jgi:four helix bundle protein
MATVRRFEDLEIWQFARKLNGLIFTFIVRGEFSKDYKLVNQINGAAGSVMDNIAEGFDRGSRKEFVQFLGFAKGSAGETKSQLYRALDRKYISQNEFETAYSLTDETGRKIHWLVTYLNESEIKGHKFKGRVEEPNPSYGNIDFDFNE